MLEVWAAVLAGACAYVLATCLARHRDAAGGGSSGSGEPGTAMPPFVRLMIALVVAGAAFALARHLGGGGPASFFLTRMRLSGGGVSPEAAAAAAAAAATDIDAMMRLIDLGEPPF